MVYRWRCRRCSFGLWAASPDAATGAVKSHLLDHAASHLRRDDVRTAWRCPHCGTEGETYGSDGDAAVESFTSHLFGHVESRLETGVHIAEAVGGTGDILVTAPFDGEAVANARAHFLAYGDAAVVVTANPAARLRLLDRKLSSWPASTTLVTTATDPLADVDVDPSARSVDVVTLDGRPDLSGVGQTLSRTLQSRSEPGRTLSVEFDILPELLDKFELRTVFRFLHLLSSRLERLEALAHYYLDPRRIRRASRNVLEGVFDLSIEAEGPVFTAASDPLG